MGGLGLGLVLGLGLGLADPAVRGEPVESPLRLRAIPIQSVVVHEPDNGERSLGRHGDAVPALVRLDLLGVSLLLSLVVIRSAARCARDVLATMTAMV